MLTLLHKWFASQSFLSPRKFKDNSRSVLFRHHARLTGAARLLQQGAVQIQQDRLPDQRNSEKHPHVPPPLEFESHRHKNKVKPSKVIDIIVVGSPFERPIAPAEGPAVGEIMIDF